MEDPHPYINCGVYALLLEDSKFYVGLSRDMEKRFRGGHNSEWTSRYEPIKIHDKFPAKVELKKLEREVTLLYMRRYGWDRVRGAGWTKVEMERPPKILRA